MFNGTHASARRASSTGCMEAQGGSNNAYTSQDVTVYQDWFPRSALELVFELESDRIANLAFDPEVVENERKVVYSERRLRVDDSNAALLEEQVQATRVPGPSLSHSDHRLAVRTSSPGRWPICRISIAPTTRRTTAPLIAGRRCRARAGASRWRSGTSAPSRRPRAAAGQ